MPNDPASSLVSPLGIDFPSDAEIDEHIRGRELVLRARQKAAEKLAAQYADVFKAKQRRDRDTYLAFRQRDQELWDVEHQDQAARAVKRAEDGIASLLEYIAEMETAVADAKKKFREAEDRAESAVEAARKAWAEHDRLTVSGSPGDITGALLTAQAANVTARELAELAGKADDDLSDLQQELTDGRNEYAGYVKDLERAAVKTPAGTAPISDMTIQANFAYMETDKIWDTLPESDRRRVVSAAKPRDLISREEFFARMRGDL